MAWCQIGTHFNGDAAIFQVEIERIFEIGRNGLAGFGHKDKQAPK